MKKQKFVPKPKFPLIYVCTDADIKACVPKDFFFLVPENSKCKGRWRPGWFCHINENHKVHHPLFNEELSLDDFMIKGNVEITEAIMDDEKIATCMIDIKVWKLLTADEFKTLVDTSNDWI